MSIPAYIGFLVAGLAVLLAPQLWLL